MKAFTNTSRLLLASRVTLGPSASACVVESDNFEYTFEGPSASLIRAILPKLNGDQEIAELARNVGASVNDVLAVLKPLNGDEIVIADMGRATSAESGSEFVDALKDECQFWAGEIYSQPFWTHILSGSASKAVILGWGIEFFHFVDSANEYMAAGVANCREDARIRELFARHYIEECEHGQIFLDGLKDCGIDPLRVRSAPPLASTRALLNHLYETAVGNCFAYAGLFAVMQPSPKRLSKAEVCNFYDGLGRTYPHARGMFDAFKRHALIDVELEHNRITLDDIVTLAPELVLRNGPAILGSARLLAEHFILFFEGINDYYGQSRTPIPRRPFLLGNVA
jgi:hypothetical protein